MMDTRIDWDATSPSTAFHNVQDVGNTNVWDASTQSVVATKRADMGQMRFRAMKFDSHYASVKFTMAAHDPFCPTIYAAGYIAYSAQIQFYRSGLVTVKGLRLAFPWHEGWVRWNDQKTWYNAFAMKGVALYCLALGAVSDNYCLDKIGGSANRSTDRWQSENQLMAVTAHGYAYGSGLGKNGILVPYTTSGICTVQPMAKAPTWAEDGDGRVQKITRGTLLTRDGHILTWGSNGAVDYYDENYEIQTASMHRLGRPGGEDTAATVSTQTFVDFAVEDDRTVAVGSDGDLYSWGYQGPGPAIFATPTIIDTGHDFTKIAASSNHLLALDSSGHVWGIGSNWDGALGLANTNMLDDWTEIVVPNVTFTSIATTTASSFALDEQGHLWSWGAIAGPKLEGLDNKPEEPDPDSGWAPFTGPTRIDSNAQFVSIDASWDAAAVDTDGNGYFWTGMSDYKPIAQLKIEAQSSSLTAATADGVAINQYGELLKLSPDGTVWENYGLPPTSSLAPEVTCATLS
jgi:hypothetical protein